MDILGLTICGLKRHLAERKISCAEVVELLLRDISEKDKRLHSYLYINENALAQAALADGRISKGESKGPLEGIPIAVKDNICTRGMPTTCASRMLQNFIPPYDASVIEKLKDAGAIIIGKTNMDEFAFGSSTETSAFGPTTNPFNENCVPGGSSGGSAAAVGANLCYGALGSDTGGSIRQPASFCGAVGMKPTYGVVSRYGLVAFASSFDQIGPLTKDVRDSCLMLNVIAGRDTRDSTSADFSMPDYMSVPRSDLKNLRIGMPREYFVEEIDEPVKKRILEVIKLAEKAGARIVDISLPHTKYGIATYYIIATAEASSNLARFDGVRYGYRTSSYKDLEEMYSNTRGEGFGDEVKRRIILGTYVLSAGYYEAYYVKAQKVRTLIKKDFEEAFKEVDVILTPTTPELAFGFGAKKDDAIRMYLSDIFTANVNLAGLPAMSLPAGFSGGLPVGVQLVAPHFREDFMFGAALALEEQLS